MGSFLVDLDRFARMIRGKLEAPPKRINIKPTAKDIRRLHRWALRTGKPIACDIETAPESPDKPWTGKDPTRARLKMLGLGNQDEALAFRWRSLSRSEERAVHRLLRDPRVRKVFHNGHWFDLRVLARCGVRCESVSDTREARRAVSATSPLKLSHCGSLYADLPPWKENEEDEEKGLVFTKDLKKLAVYNCWDNIATARVWAGIEAEPEWKTPRVKQLYRVQSELAQLAAEMHTTGIRVDKRMRKWMAWALYQEYREKERKVLKTVGVKGFECQPNHLRALIFERHAKGKYAHLARFNLPDPMDPSMYVNPKEPDTISVDEDALTLLLIDPDTPEELKTVIQLYWDAQEVWKRRSTFVVSKLISQAIGADGRLRPGWNSCGTDTGRWSCRDPNVMNIEKMLRAMYVASKGGVLVGADRMQFELRIMYAVTQDEALGDGIRAGNVYVEEAKDYFSLPKHFTKKDIKPEAYKSTKNIRLASQYGAGKKKRFQMMIKQDRSVTWEQAAHLGAAFEKRNHRTVEWWEEETARVHHCGYSETRILQRRRVYPRPPERTDTSNYPIQGTAADIKNLWMLDVRNTLKKHRMKSRLIIDLHDALYTDGPKSEAATVKRIMEDTSNVEYEIQGKKYVFPCEAETAERWSDFN